MKIGFVTNSVATEQPAYTTTRLALAAHRRGHETWVMGVDDFSHQDDGSVAALGDSYILNIKAVDVVSTGLRGDDLSEWRALVRISFLIERVSE